MNSFEARAFVEETHELLRKAANVNLTEEEEDRVLELESEALKMIHNNKNKADFRIIKNDGAGPSDDPKDINFNTLNEVEEFELIENTKFLELPDGNIKKLTFKRIVAKSKPYEVQAKNSDGTLQETPAGHPVMRMTNDFVSSGAEGFIERDDEYKPFGAASALVARLLEAKGARLIK